MTYIWEKVEIETIIQKRLESESHSVGEGRFGIYLVARKNLLESILDEIKQLMPKYTDHGPKHVRQVLENITDLLGYRKTDYHSKKNKRCLNGMELYILCLSALFHDAGNVFSREEHQKQIGQIYDYAISPKKRSQDTEEKRIILDICKAHCGDAIDGTKDTLQYVTDRAKLDYQLIRTKQLAAILRFADELAEGEQRTSHFMMQYNKFPKDQIKFHRYALCSMVDIDRPNGRILLKYHIHLDRTQDSFAEPIVNTPPVIPICELAEFLRYIYYRIEKVDQERKYAKFFCSLLEPYKETSASIRFWYHDREILIDLSPIVFSDLVVPGDPQKKVIECYEKYDPKTLIPLISSEIERWSTNSN